MILRSCYKRYRKDTHRALSPEETLENVEKRMPAAGITRVADITNLDRIGIPVFSSMRPMADSGAVSVYNGKGATPAEARVSAIMEGIERYSAEVRGRELTVSKFSSFGGDAIDPSELILPRGSDKDSEIPWVRGYDLLNKEEIMVPAAAVFHPLSGDFARLFRTNTSGLASGNMIEEAIFHGLSEVIERDAWSLVEHSKVMGPAIHNAAVSDEDGLAASMLRRFAQAEVDVRLLDITSDIEIPTIAAISDDVRLRDPALLTTGMGTHTSSRVAVLRALTEVAQSRLTQIHGAREDTSTAEMKRRIGYDRMKRFNKYWFEPSGNREFSQIESVDSDDFLMDIKHMLSKIEKSGMQRAIVVDLTAEEVGVPVVRVIVPGLEISGVDPDRVGMRCKRARDEARRIPRSKPSG